TGVQTCALPILRLLSRGGCVFEDEQGKRLPLSVPVLARFLWRLLRDWARRPGLLRRVCAQLRQVAGPTAAPASSLNWAGVPVYLRTDLVFGVRSGGSVGHIAGVLNNLGRFGAAPIFLTSDTIPTVDLDIETHRIHTA